MVNFSIASLTQIGLSLVLICWTTGSTGAAFSFEEEFLQLKENYIQMKEIVRNLESKVTELESKDVQMQEKIQQQDSLLISLLQEKNDRTGAADFKSASINQSVAVAINGLPSSCGDLKMIGHIWSGFYSIMGNTMMESVYCDFTKLPDDAGFQKWIGYVDVKSAPVHFYVQRNSSFTSGFPIPFELAVVNDGNAMNLTSGIFTAPRPGIYFFSFTGMANFQASSSSIAVTLGVSFVLNGDYLGRGWVDEANTISGQLSPLTFQSTLNLKSGDQVWVRINTNTGGTYLFDNSAHYTHFTGFMLKEEIVASL